MVVAAAAAAAASSDEISAVIPGASSSRSATQATQIDQRSIVSGSIGKGAISRSTATPVHGSATRPDDLGVTPWYSEDYPAIDSAPAFLLAGDRSSHPSYCCADDEIRPDGTSTRTSSIDNELEPRPVPVSGAPRKAYMDLRDAMALLDETCPNQEPSPSSLTPRTPRTPLTPHPKNKRARSKSSDNSASYSNERLSDRSFEKDGKEKRRPFLKKIGISMTEDKPFLAKLAPRIIGKPYLEKIGPSRAVEKPFLDKIGSSKTLDKFTFDAAPRYERTIARNEIAVVNENATRTTEASEGTTEEQQRIPMRKSLTLGQSFAAERRKSGKGHLLKMYSFETEDLETTVQAKEHRDPLRGTSLDDVLDSGPCSLPLETTVAAVEMTEKTSTPERSSSGAELLRCRVTTSEEIIFTNSSFGSDREPSSWGNSPRKKWQWRKGDATPGTAAGEAIRSRDSGPNSPTKRPISSVTASQDSERNLCSPLKARRQTYEDLLVDRTDDEDEQGKAGKQAQFERRGISSDNLLGKDRGSLTIGYRGTDQAERSREAGSSEDYLAQRTDQEYTKETFKQLQDKFRQREIVPFETYADFKRRTRGSVQSIAGRRQERFFESRSARATDNRDDPSKEAEIEGDASKLKRDEGNGETSRVQAGARTVLKKQQGIDRLSDQESDSNASIRRPKKRIFHEPSQETMDLLTELRKVKSLLKTPSWEERDLELDKKPARQPKRILLTDKEFCLSVERENSIRRPSRVIDSLEKTDEGGADEGQAGSERNGIPGPALFEKKCLSLDYADEEKPQKPEARAISLASARNLPSGNEAVANYADLAFICDSKSYSSDVFNTPSDETNEKERGDNSIPRDVPARGSENHCAEIDITIPVDRKAASPKDRVQIHGTGDLYEIISPRSTPFRAKKRLGKISVEETVKPESFTLGSKVDCRSAVTQKRTKCYPL